jgi:hypothetical protein
VEWRSRSIRKRNTTVWVPECSRPAWTSGWEHPDWFGASPPYHLRTDTNPVLKTSCSLVSARRSIKPRKQLMAECNTSLSEPYGIHAAKVHVTSYKLQYYYTAHLHISVFLLCCCCFLLSFSPTSLHIHSNFQVWTFLFSPYKFGGFILVLTSVRIIKIILPICGMTVPPWDKLQDA